MGDSTARRLRTAAVHVPGVGLFALGLLGVAVSQEAMGRSWRIGIDQDAHTELVTSGPFAIVRNPIFTALVATQAGIALLVPSLVALAGLGIQVLAVEIQARLVEEPHLLHVHGRAYADYARRVGRFLPAVGKLRSDAASGPATESRAPGGGAGRQDLIDPDRDPPLQRAE